jgi:hypothetical protein
VIQRKVDLTGSSFRILRCRKCWDTRLETREPVRRDPVGTIIVNRES